MKNKSIFTISSLIAFCIIMCLTSCTKQNEETPYTNNGLYYFKGAASAAQLVPAGTSTATASFTGVYDANSQIFSYKLSWAGCTGLVTSANFYGPSDSLQNGVVTRNIITAVTRPVTDSLTGVIWNYSRLTTTELTDLKRGKWYYTIITQANTGGEVRGQIQFDKVVY